MIISVATLFGFQQEIRGKVIGFGAHIQIDNFDANTSFEANPVSIHQDFYPNLIEEEGIEHIQVFAYKAGIVKTEDQIQGVVLKGIGSDYSWKFFQNNIIEGQAFKVTDSLKSNDVLISKFIADKLQLGIGDDMRMYFLSQGNAQPRGRKFKVSGIYQTGLEDFDKIYIIGDIGHIIKLNNWNDDQVSGFEVFIDDFDDLSEMEELVYSKTGYNLKSHSIKETYPQIFDWLKLLDRNVIVILTLMVLVSAVTMVSTLLILILERTSMIGLLKAMGMENRRVRQIFLYHAARILGLGLLWGNLTGMAIILAQYFWHIIPLDPESYYVEFVPIAINFFHIFLINLGTFIISIFILLIPSYIVSRIPPIKAIRFN